MKNRVFLILMIFITCLSAASSTAQTVKSAKPGDKGLMLTWLGTAGWEIRTGTTTILIDPFLTRQPRVRGEEWKTDEQEVLKHIKGADYIFAGHSHADHIGDIPFIAKRFGSKVIGSRTTTNLALTAGVDRAQIETIQGGEKFDLKDFSVMVVKSQHGVRQGRSRLPRLREILEPLDRPIMGEDFVVGGCYLYYFTFGTQRVLHQSTANFVIKNLTGLQPDVALLAQGDRGYGLAKALKALKPKVIMMHHFDQWRVPFSEAIGPNNTRPAWRFKRKISRVDNKIQVIIPKLLKPYTLK